MTAHDDNSPSSDDDADKADAPRSPGAAFRNDEITYVPVVQQPQEQPKKISMERGPEAIKRLWEQIRDGDAESGLSFPEWLQGQIKQRGWARWRTAETLGVSLRTLSRWLAGTLIPRGRDLDRLAQVFGERPPLMLAR